MLVQLPGTLVIVLLYLNNSNPCFKTQCLSHHSSSVKSFWKFKCGGSIHFINTTILHYTPLPACLPCPSEWDRLQNRAVLVSPVLRKDQSQFEQNICKSLWVFLITEVKVLVIAEQTWCDTLIFPCGHLPHQSPFHSHLGWGFLPPLSVLFFYPYFPLTLLPPLPGISASTERGNIKSIQL